MKTNMLHTSEFISTHFVGINEFLGTCWFLATVVKENCSCSMYVSRVCAHYCLKSVWPQEHTPSGLEESHKLALLGLLSPFNSNRQEGNFGQGVSKIAGWHYFLLFFQTLLCSFLKYINSFLCFFMMSFSALLMTYQCLVNL